MGHSSPQNTIDLQVVTACNVTSRERKQIALQNGENKISRQTGRSQQVHLAIREWDDTPVVHSPVGRLLQIDGRVHEKALANGFPNVLARRMEVKQATPNTRTASRR